MTGDLQRTTPCHIAPVAESQDQLVGPVLADASRPRGPGRDRDGATEREGLRPWGVGGDDRPLLVTR
jgi:hypothetical protein